ncbi:MAG TPA: glucose-6-phosphate dehydrogenase [Candidatus Limnocylindrales bacterium]|nr:glucose-6-phosphate dehydrogenase [Candidatus Limnocylindrales bacterium]
MTSPTRATRARAGATTAAGTRGTGQPKLRQAAPERRIENPLKEGLRLERVPDPCVIVVFGATGDLAHRKILPALYNLRRAGLLPPETSLLAYARRPYTNESYRAEMREAVSRYSRVPLEEALWDDFAAGIHYQQGDFSDPAAYRALAERIDEVDQGRGCQGNKLFYLATPPSSYTEIIENLGRAGLQREGRGGNWARIVVEKPFGHDLDSAGRLNLEVTSVFSESQVYRIDHYLGKETVRNLMVFRFGNGIFEPIWNRRYVDHVQITVAEDLGVEERGSFYEEAGAARDILQNHMLQLLSLVAMEPPIAFEADALRDEKVRVLRAVDPDWDEERVRHDVVRAQYGPGWVGGAAVPGYRDEAEVARDSTTETFVALKLEVQNWRWADVPFYLRTGKRLPKRATEIAVQFKRPPLMLFRESVSEPEPNLLALRIQPDEGILLRFAAKVPELGLDVRSVNMDFTYGTSFTTDAPEAYETLLLDAMLGDASLFTRADEVEAAWGIVTPILVGWAEADAEEAGSDLARYEAGSWGPESADRLIERDGRRWRRL